MNNPIDMIKLMMGKMTPKDIVMKMLGNNSNPMFNNLINMANNGDKKGLENFARNVFKEQGRDFDKEYNELMSNFK